MKLILETCPFNRKIAVIKLIRFFTDCGLKEAKDLSENPPATLFNKISVMKGLKIQSEFEKCGAKVSLQ